MFSAIDVGSIAVPVSPVQDLSRLTFEQIEVLCPATRLPHTLGSGTAVHLVLPQFAVMKDKMEPLTSESTGQPLTVTIEQQIGSWSGPVTYKMYAGIALACADKAYTPLLLSPQGGPEAASPDADGNFTDFSTDIRYLCLKSYDTAAGRATWKCSGPAYRGEPLQALQPTTAQRLGSGFPAVSGVACIVAAGCLP